MTLVILGNGGRHIPMIVSANVIDLDGRSCLMGIFHDISEIQMTQESLQLANKKLNLLADITRHDIRNKLTVIGGYLDLVKDRPAEPDYSMYIKKIQSTVKVIGENIEFTKLYQNLGVTAPVWQNVHDVFFRACTHIDIKKISVQSDTRELEIFADPLLERAFYNFVENSLQHGGACHDDPDHRNGIPARGSDRSASRITGRESPPLTRTISSPRGLGEIPVLVSSWYRRSSPSPGSRSGRPGSITRVHGSSSESRTGPTVIPGNPMGERCHILMPASHNILILTVFFKRMDRSPDRSRGWTSRRTAGFMRSFFTSFPGRSMSPYSSMVRIISGSLRASMRASISSSFSFCRSEKSGIPHQVRARNPSATASRNCKERIGECSRAAGFCCYRGCMPG